MNDNNLTEFEKGFVKQAVEMGADEQMLLGIAKEANEIMDYYRDVIKIAEENSGDPNYREKLANELMYASKYTHMVKVGNQGAGVFAPPDFLNSIGKNIGGLFGNQNAGAGLGGGAVGGLGGGLLGLILGKLLFDNPLMGLLLGAAGGGGLGHMWGSGKLQNMLGGQQQPPPTDPAAAADPDAIEAPGMSLDDPEGAAENLDAQGIEPKDPGMSYDQFNQPDGTLSPEEIADLNNSLNTPASEGSPEEMLAAQQAQQQLSPDDPEAMVNVDAVNQAGQTAYNQDALGTRGGAPRSVAPNHGHLPPRAQAAQNAIGSPMQPASQQDVQNLAQFVNTNQQPKSINPSVPTANRNQSQLMPNPNDLNQMAQGAAQAGAATPGVPTTPPAQNLSGTNIAISSPVGGAIGDGLKPPVPGEAKTTMTMNGKPPAPANNFFPKKI